MILYRYSKEKFCLGHSRERRKMLRRRASCFTVIVSLQFLVQSLILQCIIIIIFFFYDNTVHNTADCTLPFSLGVVVAVAQHNHIKKKMDRKRVDDNNQNGRPERCETHWSHWCPLLTTVLEYESSLSSEKIYRVCIVNWPESQVFLHYQWKLRSWWQQLSLKPQKLYNFHLSHSINPIGTCTACTCTCNSDIR